MVSDLDGSLVSWWRMDDVNDSGDVVDYMGRNNGSVIGGANQTVYGKFGRAWEFDGDGDRVNIQDISVGSGNNVSISLWFKTNITGWAVIIGEYADSSSAGVWMSTSSISRFNARVSNGTLHLDVSPSQNVVDNTWHHAVAVFNRTGNLSVYIDGILGASQNMSGYVGDDIGSIKMIGATETASYHYNGSLDEVMIFNRSLNYSEVIALYNATTSLASKLLLNTITSSIEPLKGLTKDPSSNSPPII